MMKDARDDGYIPGAQTVEAAGYVLLVTSLPREKFSKEDVMEIYRARWQVELVFKRLKSLLELGAVPKTTDDSALAWMQGKLLIALLLEKLLAQAQYRSTENLDGIAEGSCRLRRAGTWCASRSRAI